MQVAIDLLIYDRQKTTKEVIDKPRLHVQVGSNVQVDEGMDAAIVAKLQALGHKIDKAVCYYVLFLLE